MPSFYEAGILSGRPIGEAVPCDYKMIVVAPASKKALEGVAGVGVELTADPKIFARMLAKIALGVAVAKFGPEGFEPFARDLIVARPEHLGGRVRGFRQKGARDNSVTHHRASR